MQPAVVEAVARSQQFSPLAPLLFATSTCWKGDKVKTFLSHRHATPPALVGKLNWGATRIEAMRWRCVGRVNQIRWWKPAEISAWICNINWHGTPRFYLPLFVGIQLPRLKLCAHTRARLLQSYGNSCMQMRTIPAVFQYKYTQLQQQKHEITTVTPTHNTHTRHTQLHIGCACRSARN